MVSGTSVGSPGPLEIKIPSGLSARRVSADVSHGTIVTRHPRYRDIKIVRRDSLFPDAALIKEYLRVGVPIGLSIFTETSIFGVVAFLIAPFGTAAIAASQAAMNFSSLVYMLPLSVSMRELMASAGELSIWLNCSTPARRIRPKYCPPKPPLNPISRR